jgi:nicotinamidase-related amidase
MQTSDLTARQYYAEVKARPARAKFGFGAKAALVNIDLQCAYTRPDEFVTAYETDPRQLEYVNALAELCRAKGWPVIWTYVAYMESAADAGVWGTRTNTPDSLQNIKADTRRSELDPRLTIDHCVRACAVDSLSRGYRTIVVEEAVADKHEIPHFANLTDMLLKYADVESFETVRDYLAG